MVDQSMVYNMTENITNIMENMTNANITSVNTQSPGINIGIIFCSIHTNMNIFVSYITLFIKFIYLPFLEVKNILYYDISFDFGISVILIAKNSLFIIIFIWFCFYF